MRLPRLLPLLALALIPLFVRAAAPVLPVVPAAPAAAPTGMINKLNLRDAPVQMVLDLLEQWTGKIVLRPQTLSAIYVTINISSPVTLNEAIDAVLSALQVNGIGVVPVGEKFLLVLNTGGAASLASRASPELIKGSTLDLPGSTRIVMKIFELKFLQPATIAPQVQNTIITQGSGQAVGIPGTNILVVTDMLSNVQRVETLLKMLDRPLSTDVEPRFIQMKNASASDISTRLTTILANTGPLASYAANLSLSFDARTNQLIVVGVDEQFALIEKLVSNLDKEAIPNTQTKVYALKTASASQVLTTMQTLIQNQTQALNAAQQATNNNRGQGGNARGQGAAGAGVNGAGNQNVRGGGAAGAAAGGAAGAAAGGGAVAAGGGAAGGAGAGGGAGGAGAAPASASTTDFSPYLSLVADVRTNSIVVSGTPSDLNIVGKLIDSIDFALPQVRIEVVIVDVALTDQFDSGISALGLEIKNDRLVGISGSSTGLTLGGAVTLSATSTTFSRILDPTKIVSNTGLTGIVSLATTPRKNMSNIVSSPTIRTMHNTTGTIFVGEQRSFASGSVTNGGTGGSTTTFQQLNIGVTLTVLPLIGADGTVQMSIQQSVTDFVGNDANGQPVTATRTTSSTISCKSEDIIVVGGLQRTSSDRSSSMLGGIPLIGDLLGARHSGKSRNDLIFFVRPTVTRDSIDNRADAVKATESFDKDTKKTVDQLLDIKSATPDTTAAPKGGAAAAPPPAGVRPVPSGSTRRPN